jgi:carbohydrate esterase-like sialic acid-specific acetylesterase
MAMAQVDLHDFPSNGQLYPRGAGNFGNMPVSGAVTEAGWDEVVIRMSSRTALIGEQVLPLQYAGTSTANFATSGKVRAGLRDYVVELLLRRPGEERSIRTATSVVSGDVFLVQGQSNAVALDYWGEQLANQSQSWWLRSFGTQALGATEVRNNKNWYLAEGETQRTRGAVGSWALELGARLIEEVGVPVAIINGAVGGTAIIAHLRNDAEPDDTTTIYGRLLFRAEAAGLREHARAIFWYQGESDGPNAIYYGRRFDELMDDWREDYPSLEKVYLMQVRQGCAVGPDSLIFEAQRELPLRHPEVQLMSTSAQPAHDGCHYLYAGYLQLSNQLARLVARDFYGRPYGPEIAPPDAIAAWRSNAAGDEITVEFDAAAVGLVAQPGSQADFLFEDGARVLFISEVGPRLILHLDRATTSTTLRYVGHVGNDGYVVNRLGIGALYFDLPL